MLFFPESPGVKIKCAEILNAKRAGTKMKFKKGHNFFIFQIGTNPSH